MKKLLTKFHELTYSIIFLPLFEAIDEGYERAYEKREKRKMEK